MIFRLKTSQEALDILTNIKNTLGITPNLSSRIAIGFSLRHKKKSKEEINKKYKKINNSGIEFQRHTLIGENQIVYKVLFENFCNESLTDEEFFPVHFKYHLENGLKELKAEAEISNNLDTFVKNLINQ